MLRRMGFWGRLLGRSAVTFSSDFDRPASAIFGVGFGASEFVRPVDRLEALTVPAVTRGRNMLCSIGGLPLVQYAPDLSRVPLPLLTQIDPDIPNSVTISQTVEDLIFEGLSWWRVTALGFDGYPVSARHIDHRSVVIQMPATGEYPAWLPAGYDPRGATIFVDGHETPPNQLIRFDSPNPALLKIGGPAIRRALLLNKAAAMYADDPRPGDYFTPADGADSIEDDEVADILSKWKAARKARSTAWVPQAMKYNTVDSPSPADLQLVELQKQATLDIANLMGLDPEDLAASTTSRTYQNATDRRQDRINETLSPYMSAITDRLSMADVTKRGYVVQFDLDRYMQADPATRWATYSIAKTIGVLSPDEIRAKEMLPPGEDVEPEPAAESVPAGLATVTDLAAHSQRARGFAADGGLVFDVSTVAAAFSVDEQRRTITGLVMPWGEVGRSGGAKWRFSKDSLKFSKAHLNQLKLLTDHDSSQPVGRLERTWSDDTGQWATFKVARGPEGDRALASAADGVRDGLSVGIGYEGTDAGFTFTDDPTEPGVRLVTAAPWRETSLVALPAFASARTTAVQMAADPEGMAMTTATEPQTPEAAPVAAVTYTADQVAAMFAAMKPAAPAVEPERPAVVNPTVLPVPTAKVGAELPLYRFDGGKGQRNFTTDIANGFDGDSTLRHKAEEFVADQMAAAFTNIAVSAVTTLNPTIQRPDLYVPNLYFSRPIGSMVTGGVVDSITRQTLPKFSASAGLAALHVEGTEPTDGSFSTTSQNVDPKAISGRVTVNREVIDQGGTPQTDQLLWNEMTQFYAKLLETRLVDALQALSLSDTPIVGLDDVLQRALLTEFAGLQFLAGGDRYRGLALNSDLYTAVISAVDGDGRSLFPMLNPTNAAGTTASDYSNVRVGSKVGVPAWALSSGNGGPDKSFLFAPESVYQWFSPPRRIDLDRIAVATVGIGIWGYSAEFVSRNSDVIQLAYTAS